jgi:site-specific DNA recombinase
VSRIIVGDSLRGICLDWNKPGAAIPGTTGRQWTTRTLKRMLTSPRIAGLREHNGKLYPAAWSPIIPREQWEVVRAILEDPARRTIARGGVHRYLLTGMAFCGVCGTRLVGIRKGDYFGYRCPKTERGDGGKCVQRSAAPVEELITEALFEAVESPAWDEHAAERPADDPARPHYEALAQITADLDVLEGMLAEAEIAERQGRTPKPSAATLRRKLIEREAEAERHQAAVNRLKEDRVIAELPRNLRDVWLDLSLDRRRAILKAVLKLPPEGFGIEIHPTGPGRRTFDPDAIKADWRV